MNLSWGVASQINEPGLGRRAENEARAKVGKVGPVSRGVGVVGLCEKEGRRERSERWRDATFIPRESGARPVHAPCLMRGSRFPDAHLPSGRLLF